MTSKSVGLIHKYSVTRTDGRPVGWCFVLEDKDPLAVPALVAYRDAAQRSGYHDLAGDLSRVIDDLITRHGTAIPWPAPGRSEAEGEGEPPTR